MNFRPELAAKVMAGEKTVTRRLVSGNPNSLWFAGRCGYEVGQDVAICPGRGKPAIGHALVTGVAQEPLGFVSRVEAAREGFGSAYAFAEAWRDINGGYDPEAIVWRIELDVVILPRRTCWSRASSVRPA